MVPVEFDTLPPTDGKNPTVKPPTEAEREDSSTEVSKEYGMSNEQYCLAPRSRIDSFLTSATSRRNLCH